MIGVVTVKLAAALMCFNAQCYPVLVGTDTPVGTFTMQHVYVDSPGYGGDVLIFKQDDNYAWAIHRVWRMVPQEHRLDRLEHGSSKDRWVTKGCINVMPDVYTALVDCCSRYELIISP